MIAQTPLELRILALALRAMTDLRVCALCQITEPTRLACKNTFRPPGRMLEHSFSGPNLTDDQEAARAVMVDLILESGWAVGPNVSHYVHDAAELLSGKKHLSNKWRKSFRYRITVERAAPRAIATALLFGGWPWRVEREGPFGRWLSRQPHRRRNRFTGAWELGHDGLAVNDRVPGIYVDIDFGRVSRLVDRTAVPEAFFDITAARLLLHHEPQYPLATAALDRVIALTSSEQADELFGVGSSLADASLAPPRPLVFVHHDPALPTKP